MSFTLHIVSGPPASGKSTYVQQHRDPDSIVIDFDHIAAALGFPDRTRPNGLRGVVRAGRIAMIDSIIENRRPWRADIWVIDTSPVASALERYEKYKGQVQYHVLNPGVLECKRRAAADRRPDWTYAVIDEWYQDKDRPLSGTSPAVTITTRDAKSNSMIPVKRSQRQ